MAGNECQLNVAPFYQCCCNCIHLVPDLWHCSTQPEPVNHDLCYKQRGWACIAFLHDSDRGAVMSRWSQHSCGCEMYEKREEK
jgi:hypothetical protein